MPDGEPHLPIRTADPDERPCAADTPRMRTEPVTIHSYDVDARRRLTIESLCRYLLEAAWNHAEQLGVGFAALSRNNKVWVLSRWLLEIHAYPSWGDQVTLKTWPRGRESLFALREFELRDRLDHLLVGGSSSWLIIDQNSRRPQRIEKMVEHIYSTTTRATVRDAQKIENKVPLPASETSAAARFEVGYSDEDLNGHVNSARYIRWLLDSYSRVWHEAHAVRQLEINYLGECHAGDFVQVLSKQTGELSFLHSIVRHDGHEAVRATIDWQNVNL